MPEPGSTSGPNAPGLAPGARPQRRAWALALLAIPIAAVIWPPLFNQVDPTLGGLPFFVWYQLAAVVLGGVVTAVVYLLRGTEREGEAHPEESVAATASTTREGAGP